MKKAIIVFVYLLYNCAPFTYSHYKLSETEKTFIYKIQNQSTEFNYPEEQDELYWGRAGSFVAQYSSMKIQTANDFVIETYNPYSLFDFGWKIVKTPVDKDSNKIQINNITTHDSKSLREKICAWYIRTGELPPDPKIIYQYRDLINKE